MATISRRTLIRGGTVIAGAEAGEAIERGEVLVDDGIVVAVGRSLEAEGAEIVEADGMIVMPGLVDTHKHTWQSAIRHRCTDIDLNPYFGEMFANRGARYSAEDVYIGNLLGALAAIDGGTTTLMDWSHIQNSPAHSDRAIDALQESGIRAIFGHGWPCVDLFDWIADSALPHTDDVRRIRESRLSDDGALVTLQLAGRGPELATIEATRADLAMARDLGIRTSIHMGCGVERGELAAIAQLGEAGLLGSDLNFVHCSESSDAELDLMAEHGISISLAPQHEFIMGGIGYSPIDRCQARGISIGLSSDTEAVGPADLFVQMRAALAAQRSVVNEGRSRAVPVPEPLSAADVFRMATLGGAEALGIADRVGVLRPGYQADLILIRGADLNLHPVSDPIAAVVTAAHPGNVDSVMVAGRFLKRAGALVGRDLEGVRAAAQESHDRLLRD
ncbi:amidohydrolase family protein [Leucobacter weissii]|uniref:Amidohydrolase family protein n=1 Tax=Leucobacter weissii TaxID=1983706 RepID=A0A939MK80_9MICO|nr:amidohydrolase family protein [Leucobacter weissii]MBO1901760.1 amidohydrolase family protein [Leucobacter weissii]